jgi:hypothetical protein
LAGRDAGPPITQQSLHALSSVYTKNKEGLHLKRQHVRTITVFVILFVFGAGFVLAQTTDSLYKRLGGYDAIAAVVDDFIGRLASDPQQSRSLSDTAMIQSNGSVNTLSTNFVR